METTTNQVSVKIRYTTISDFVTLADHRGERSLNLQEIRENLQYALYRFDYPPSMIVFPVQLAIAWGSMGTVVYGTVERGLRVYGEFQGLPIVGRLGDLDPLFMII